MNQNGRHRGSRGGFTLLEVMFASAALTIVGGVLYSLTISMARTAAIQETDILLRDNARTAMVEIVRNVRMSQRVSLQTSDGLGGFGPITFAPMTNILYRRVGDADGNQVAVNANLTLGLDPAMQYTLDWNDANGDGRTTTQLVLLQQDGTFVRAVANHVSPPFAMNNPADFYNAPQGGLIFQNLGGGAIQVTLIMRRRPSPDSPIVVARLDEVVSIRN